MKKILKNTNKNNKILILKYKDIEYKLNKNKLLYVINRLLNENFKNLSDNEYLYYVNLYGLLEYEFLETISEN